MMKKSFLLASVLLFFMLGIKAQQKISVETINPFTYGKTVTTVEDNFENLFRNIPHLISNPNNIVFLGYKYAGTVQNIQDVKRYLSEDLYSGAATVGFSSLQNRKGETYDVKIMSNKIEAPQESIVGLINTFAKNIYEGYKVYQIEFIIDHRKQHYNVFVNPETKQVVAENNAFILPHSARVK